MYNTDKTMLYRVLPECKTLTIPETVTRICRGSIEYTNLNTLVIPNTVKEMAGFAVCDNPQLRTLVIGNGLNVIEPFTFSIIMPCSPYSCEATNQWKCNSMLLWRAIGRECHTLCARRLEGYLRCRC